jgi:hypothetical protein
VFNNYQIKKESHADQVEKTKYLILSNIIKITNILISELQKQNIDFEV